MQHDRWNVSPIEDSIKGLSTTIPLVVYPQREVPSEDELREELMQGTDSEELAVVPTDARAHVAAEVSTDETALAGDE